MATAIWWIRRDLRLADNQALALAGANGRPIIPLFILDPALLQSRYNSPRRQAFLFQGLAQLNQALRGRGSRLVVRSGRPLEVLSGLAEAHTVSLIAAEADVSPYARQRDEAIGRLLPLKLAPGLTVHPPGAVLKSDGTPYTVFTPFSRTWRSLPLPQRSGLLAAPEKITTPDGIQSEPLSEAPLAAPDGFPAGEVEGQRRLATFTREGIFAYKQDRNRMDLEGTSALSPYLRFGMVSLRQAVVAALEARVAAGNGAGRAGADTWLSELIWREFYLHILYHFPEVRRRSFKAKMRRFPWRDDEAGLAAWRRGQTGYPVVDAAMRQLAESGWMHNRARMIVASFLTKHLLIHWAHGEQWFMQQLVDGDPAANNGGWQWTAGTGTDAAPYFRIFNPILQGEKFDPRGEYVRRWLPELTEVPDRYIHKPWEMPDKKVQRQVGCLIGQDYPAPIVEHSFARQRALEALAETKKTDD